MKNQMLQILIAIMLMLNACSDSKIEKIPLEIPLELKGNTQAEALISEMTDAVNDCREATIKIARVAIKNESGSPGLMQSVKLGNVSIGFANAQSKIADCISRAGDMSESLTESQHSSLMACINNLEKRSVEIDNPEALGMTPEEFEQFKQENIAMSNMSDEEMPYNEADTINEYRSGATGYMDEDFNSGEVIEMPRFMHILFPVFVIGLIVFIVIRRIKKAIGKTKELGYTISSTKSKISEAKEMMEREGKEDSPEYQNAKKALDFMEKFAGNKN
jgi:hypothetical protein